MVRRYIIRKNDTLGKIAKRFYKDTGLYKWLPTLVHEAWGETGIYGLTTRTVI